MLYETEEAHRAVAKTARDMPPSKTDYAIDARGLHKIYRAQKGQPAKEALGGIDLRVKRGSIFALLGPNGAGKSTFINILGGLTIKSGGRVRIWGFDIDVNPREARAAIGIVPQELHIDPFFTPREILDLQAGLYGVPRRERRTDEILRLLSLEDKADAYSRTLSGGMRRRLMVMKAMVHAPPILVLDEPTAGVDIELRRQLWAHVRQMNAEGVTIILTTHYLEEAEALCDRIAIIDDGAVIAEGATSDLVGQMDAKQLVITPEARLARVPSMPPDVEARLDGEGRLRVHYHPRSVKMAVILSALSDAGVVVADMTTREPALEDLFVRLTRGAGGSDSSDGGDFFGGEI